MNGVARFGIGGWKRILTCPDYSFNKRTAVDLKDRFRVCRPDAYQGPSKQAQARTRKRHARSPSAETTDPSHADSVTLKHPLSADVSVGNGNQHQDVQGSHVPHSHENFFKVPRRSRNMFTEEDDMHLLQGFMRHGKSWQSIQRDPELHLCRRKPTDLRDRFRIRFPEKYAQTGLAPRPTTFPKPQKRSRPANSGVEATASNALETSATTRSTTDDHRSRTIHPAPFQGNEADNYFDDLFADDEEHANGPITLDRSIIDETLPSLSMTTILRDTESSALFGIDPLDTLRLPPLRPP
ncbi:hypothetical protein M8818_005385 [Zalaria obscura]|uniref:Uncharacterized protein n=1 Tax=Zalaria obscura TaxID=2024903 RepID=A0ACC3S7T2_9PEZI